ncbi:MAG: hypothetical protein IKL37_03260 [Alphaproteobacteria bacterium]|nr:hypothetical protein [Alphaproteobacteria bacterium]
MNRLKKFWITFLPFFVIGTANAGLITGLLGAGLVLYVGARVFRTAMPYDMPGALEFFSNCWTCQMFSDILSVMSHFVSQIYSSVGGVTIMMVVALTAIWFAWKLFSGFMNGKVENPWSITETFTHHMVKMTCVILLLMAPVPRLMSDIAIRPIFNVGLILNRAVANGPDFNNCLVATAMMDTSVDSRADAQEAYPPQLRHEIACELLGVHQLTGMGITLGWTMMQMAFDYEYMHSIVFGAIFPNVPLFFIGLLMTATFLMALLPVPLYFLEIFIKLSMDLIMLPLMLLAWLFKGWAISLEGAGKTIRGIIDDVINGALGLGLTGVFINFGINIIDALVQNFAGAESLLQVIQDNNTQAVFDSVMLNDSGFISMLLIGMFIAMFMSAIPALAKTLFNVEISQEYYDKAVNNAKVMWNNSKKMWESLKK